MEQRKKISEKLEDTKDIKGSDQNNFNGEKPVSDQASSQIEAG
jgi:hypothetical protein